MKDHYATLNLSSKRLGPISPKDLKSAYRASLLHHHPDKSASSLSAPGSSYRPDSLSKSDLSANVPQQQQSAKLPLPAREVPGITIDAITQAYTVLANESSKAAYDIELARFLARNRTTTTGTSTAGCDEPFRSVEFVDLDDLTAATRSEDGKMEWVRACRCAIYGGREFVVSEDDLDATTASLDQSNGVATGAGTGAGTVADAGADALATTHGEVLVCCRGCSLWLRVGFAVVDE